jgi:hypothetical protein
MKKFTLKENLLVALAFAAFVFGGLIGLVCGVGFLFCLAMGGFMFVGGDPISWRFIFLTICCPIVSIFGLYLAFVGNSNIEHFLEK